MGFCGKSELGVRRRLYPITIEDLVDKETGAVNVAGLGAQDPTEIVLAGDLRNADAGGGVVALGEFAQCETPALARCLACFRAGMGVEWRSAGWE